MEIICAILAAGLAGALCLAFYYRGLLRSARYEQARLRADMNRQKTDFDRISAASEKRFSELAAQALASNSEAMRKASVNSLSEVLAPMKENLDSFRRSFSERYDKEARERYALGNNIAKLIEVSTTVGAETARLASALKGNARMQGEWGEMILDNILRSAGFRRGFDYEVQASVNTDEGKQYRPDVIINYADDRRLVIDSKVSIQDYLNMMDAASDDRRDSYARAHLVSVKKHIGELARKSYQDVIGQGTFDYVLMFIPNEGAFLSAMSMDSNLWHTAYESRVLIISPTHLLAVVKLIEQMWRQDKQNRNAMAIAEEAGKMLDKFSGFLDDLGRIDRSLAQAREAWNGAFNKLSAGNGNLIGRAHKIKELGARSKKNLPQASSGEGGE